MWIDCRGDRAVAAVDEIAPRCSSRGQGKRDDRDTKPSYVKPDQMVNEGFEQYYKVR